MMAYHFVADTLRDGRPVPPDGEWLVHEGRVEICDSGLHASAHPYDALQYAPGPILCLVDCGDIVAEQDDKFVCRRRKIIARFDATDLMRAFARHCALSVIHLWDAPDVVRRYLETGDESLRDAARAARDAARDAAWAARAAAMAARDAAWAARAAAMAAARDACDATWAARAAARAASDAARDAAWDAAWAAAMAAASDAARDAAWDAAWAAAMAAARDAARDAAWDAARDAARDAACAANKNHFAELVNAKFRELT